MKRQEFERARSYMQSCMQQSVHDTNHVDRVVHNALRIAATLPKADITIVLMSALLHDIGRAQAAAKKGLGHAEAGADMARAFLLKSRWSPKQAEHVHDCILTHSYKAGRTPKSIEAKIVFDADKLDLTGAIGTARALLFGAEIGEPLYVLGKNGLPTPGKPQEGPSLLREYNRKLKILSQKFYTPEGKRLAAKRQIAMDRYFKALRKELDKNYKKGSALLQKHLDG